jgi:serine/threonine-protein kinase
MGDAITQIGRYEISRQLVDTALASVYDAFDPVERKPVAIRVPRTTQHGLGPYSSGLRHPGLMTVLSCEQTHGESFLVLEPFEGKPLDTILPPGQKLPPEEALDLIRQLASALDYAHSHGSIHGSLHPSSILLNDRGEIKVLDLGAADTIDRKASAEQLLRAVNFLSPECLRDQPMDGRCDQFSLAVLAHRMLTGELPFHGTPLGVMFRIAYQGLERDAIRELPPAAQTVFQRSLAKRPDERYATCGEMVDTLENALNRRAPAPTRLADASEFAAPRTPAPTALQRSGLARHFTPEALKYFGITFAVCALLLAGLAYFLRPKAPPKPPVAAAPATAQPAAPPAPVPVPGLFPPPPAQPEAKAKPVVKNKARKKTEPEVELKPAEPKIIR